MVDLKDVRARSWKRVRDLGLLQNPSLPLLDEAMGLRNTPVIADRVLALNCVVAVSYGFQRDVAFQWLRREALVDALSPDELQFLDNGEEDAQRFRWQAESLFAFTTMLGVTPKADLLGPCPNDLVHRFPDLKRSEDSDAFRSRATLIDESDALANCDLLYCVHWAAVESRGTSILDGLRVESLIERRRAYEWALGAEAWDEVALDT